MMQLRVFNLTCVLMLAAITARGADPRLDAIVPPGAQRDTEVEVSLLGGRVGQEPLGLIFYQPGIELLEIKTQDDNHARARLRVAADCVPGVYPLRVRTASGISDLRTFHIGTLPVVDELEPNNDFANPQAIALDCTVHGVIKNEDVDFFVVEAKAGERLSVEIEGLRLGRTFFDPYVAILNEQRFELARSDDAIFARQDGACSVVVPTDGRYLVEVRESSYRGSDACTYRLHVGRFPRPTAVFPCGGAPGETVEFRWLGDPLGELVRQVKLPADSGEEVDIFAEDAFGMAPTGNRIRVNKLPAVRESEPNGGRKSAGAVSVPGAVEGIVDSPGDVDLYSFDTQKGQVLHLRVLARQLRSPLDPVLVVTDAKGKRLASNDDRTAYQPDSYLRFSTPADGRYFLRLRDHLNSGGPDYTYRIEIEPIAPKVQLQLRDQRQFVAETIAVPQGNRVAALVQATREDFGGDLAFDVSGLPEGVEAETLPLPAGQSLVPLLLHATPDAEPAGGLISLSARRADDGPVTSRFQQKNWLIRGTNNIDVHSHTADRAAVAVISRVPFRIEAVESKVPIVQSGSMSLRVVAQRDEGFEQPIRLYLLYNPPGVSSSRSVSIAKGQTEASIPVTTAGNAQLAEWPIVVVGEANVAGRLVVASPLAKLRVASPYVALSFPKVAAEQGTSLEYTVGVEQRQPFEGTATVELLGLPPGATSQPLEMTKQTSQLVFSIQLAADARVGQHKNLFCRVVLIENGEPITHSIGHGQLRVDAPLPPNPAQTAQR